GIRDFHVTGVQTCALPIFVVNAAVLGLETSPALVARYGAWFDAVNVIAQAIFTVEIAIRLTAHWPRPQQFFRDSWNTFDFVVVRSEERRVGKEWRSRLSPC